MVGICVLLGALVWITFVPALHYGFVDYDDHGYVYENPRITSGVTLGSIEWAFTHVHADNWHPLTTLSHMLDCQLYGLQPWGHHFTNVLLQAAAAVLLFLALRSLSGALWRSALVAALFAIHPLRAESVAWIAERKDVLSGVFFMLTLWSYARYARTGRRSLGRYGTTLAAFSLGLLCKPTLVTLPFVLLLLDYWPLDRVRMSDVKGEKLTLTDGRRGTWLALLREKIPLFALSGASCVATIVAQQKALDITSKLPLGARVGNALPSYVAYVGQMFWPAHLAVLYPYRQGHLNFIAITFACLFLSSATGLFVFLRRSYPFLLVGWLWFLGVLIPMIGLVQVGPQPRADRYTYLSQIGLCILVTWGVMGIFAKRRHRDHALAVTASLIIAALVVRSRFQISSWRDSVSLWQNAIEETSDNYIAENALGSVLLRKQQPELAMGHFRKAMEIKPDYMDAYMSAGTALMGMGQIDQAIGYFQRTLQFKPDFAEAWSNLGTAFLKKGQPDDAIGHYRQAAALEPASADLQYNLGRAYASESDWGRAIDYYRAALRIRPAYAKVHNDLGVALAGEGRPDEALAEVGVAIADQPNYPQAHYNCGLILRQLGRREDAILHLREALRLKPDYTEAEKQLEELER